MPILSSDSNEIDCPICLRSFAKGEVVYRPLIDGNAGKPYHKDCLYKWCNKDLEKCIDPMTRIKFNFLHSKISCNYDRSHKVSIHFDGQEILLGTEPCDRFYDIKKFISAQYQTSVENLMLYDMIGKTRQPVIDEHFITKDCHLELDIMMDTIDLDTMFLDKIPRQNKIDKLTEDLKAIETLGKSDHISPDEITIAAKKSLDVMEEEKTDAVDEFYEPETPLRIDISETKRRLKQIDREMKTVRPNDPKLVVLQTTKKYEEKQYVKFLSKAIGELFEKVKHVLSAFLSRSYDFVTDPETSENLNYFLLYVSEILKYVWNAIKLIGYLSWQVCRYIPAIVKYIYSNLRRHEDDEDDEEPRVAVRSEEPKYDPEPNGGFFAPIRRMRDAPNLRFLEEAGVDVSGPEYAGLRKGDAQGRKGLMFKHKRSKRVHRRKSH